MGVIAGIDLGYLSFLTIVLRMEGLNRREIIRAGDGGRLAIDQGQGRPEN